MSPMQRSLFVADSPKRSKRKPSLIERADRYEEGQLECARRAVAEPNRYRGFFCSGPKTTCRSIGTRFKPFHSEGGHDGP